MKTYEYGVSYPKFFEDGSEQKIIFAPTREEAVELLQWYVARIPEWRTPPAGEEPRVVRRELGEWETDLEGEPID